MAEPIQNQSLVESLSKPPAQPRKLTDLQIHVARLYGTGMERRKIQRALVDYLAPNQALEMRVRVQQARRKLLKWERDPAFRDEVYKNAVVDVDMNLPGVLKGVVSKAKRGRVDAARLVLELTGRHNPKGDHAPPSVVVHIDGIPRPTVKQIADAEVVDAEGEGG